MHKNKKKGTTQHPVAQLETVHPHAADWKIRSLYIGHLNPKVVNRMLPHAAGFSPHITVRVIESEGRRSA